MSQACVYIVGAGPGAPDLLTVKAARLIREADAVVYDKLVSQHILDLIPENCKSIYVGKASGHHPIPQEEINKILVELTRDYKKVVRLKGGDPLVFGRGGEEALELYDHQINFEFVPGITAASACATYAGIPLTHRGLADSVRFLTGHPAMDRDLHLNLQSLGDPKCTLVIYMGVSTQDAIVSQLLEAGRDPQTPAAIVERGTTNQQRRIVTTIENLVNASIAQSIRPPAVLIIGEVVSLAYKLSWFKNVRGDEVRTA